MRSVDPRQRCRTGPVVQARHRREQSNPGCLRAVLTIPHVLLRLVIVRAAYGQ
ncbi:hypothetical protein JNUCC0626_08965 [Lentzea sp. JNUCC 0626]|uniref:hypothetical protein n=1 Tax=Lentzea sp. JNUCC 0626 TaxID=3367513 RepID=UPI00374A6B13